MSNLNQEPFDINNVEFKMPEEDFLNNEPAGETTRTLPIILILIILLLLLVLGGLIWWGKELIKPAPPEEIVPTVTRPTDEENDEPETTNAEADVSVIKTTSSSGEWPDIEADLKATDISITTKEMSTIDNYLNEKLP